MLNCFTLWLAHAVHDQEDLGRPFDLAETAWTFVLRFCEAGLTAGPTLACGLVVAALLRAFVSPARLRSVVGDHPVWAPLRIVLLSVLTPVCALGAIPIANELRRAGFRIRIVVVFLVTAPVLNLLWLAYGYNAMAPVHWTMTIVACTAVAIAVGYATQWWKTEDASAAAPDRARTRLSQRLRALGPALVDAVDGPMIAAVCLGLIGAGLIGGFVGPGGIEHHVAEDHAAGIPWLAAIMSVAYVTPEMAVVFSQEAFGIGLLPGAAVAMTFCGVGLCLGTFAWLIGRYGVGAAGRFAAAALIAAIIGSFAVQAAAPIDHLGIADSHAFDHVNMPHHPPESAADVGGALRRRFREDITAAGPIGLGLFAVCGVVRFARRRRTSDVDAPAPTEHAPDDSPPTSWAERPLSRRALTGALAVVIAGGCVVALYVLYPPPGATFRDLDKEHGFVVQAVMLRDRDEALARLSQTRRLLAQLRTGAALRPWSGCEACAVAIERFDDEMGRLSSAITEGDTDEARKLAVTSTRSLRDYRVAAGLR